MLDFLNDLLWMGVRCGLFSSKAGIGSAPNVAGA